MSKWLRMAQRRHRQRKIRWTRNRSAACCGSFQVNICTGCYTSTYWDYKKPGAKIIQINPGRTFFDSEASLNIREEADPVFEELMKKFS